jgi:hypothetical protein
LAVFIIYFAPQKIPAGVVKSGALNKKKSIGALAVFIIYFVPQKIPAGVVKSGALHILVV